MNTLDWLREPGEGAIEITDIPELAEAFGIPARPEPTVPGTSLTENQAKSLWFSNPAIQANPDWARALLADYPVRIDNAEKLAAAVDFIGTKMELQVRDWQNEGFTAEDIHDFIEGEVDVAIDAEVEKFEEQLHARIEENMEKAEREVGEYLAQNPDVSQEILDLAMVIGHENPTMAPKDVFKAAEKAAGMIEDYAEDATGLPGALQQAVAGIPGLEDVEFLSEPDLSQAFTDPEPVVVSAESVLPDIFDSTPAEPVDFAKMAQRAEDLNRREAAEGERIDSDPGRDNPLVSKSYGRGDIPSEALDRAASILGDDFTVVEA